MQGFLQQGRRFCDQPDEHRITWLDATGNELVKSGRCPRVGRLAVKANDALAETRNLLLDVWSAEKDSPLP